MSNFFRRNIAFLLLPCLVAEPARAFTADPSPQQQIQSANHRDLFERNAMATLSFIGGGISRKTSSRIVNVVGRPVAPNSQRGYFTVADGPNHRNHRDPLAGRWRAPNTERSGRHGLAGIPGTRRRHDDAQDKLRPSGFSEKAIDAKLRYLQITVGDLAYQYLQRAILTHSFSWFSAEASILRVARVLMLKYLTATSNEDPENEFLLDLHKFITSFHPRHRSPSAILDELYARDAADSRQNLFREGISRALSIPVNRVFFINPHDIWMNTFFTLTQPNALLKTRKFIGMTTPYDHRPGAAPEKAIVVFADSSPLDSLITLAHEGSHWEQSLRMLKEMEEDQLTMALGEGFQRYREFAVLMKMTQDPLVGADVLRLVEEAYTEMHPLGGSLSFGQMLWIVLHPSDAPYMIEAVVVRAMIRRMGLEPMAAYFLSGNRDILQQSLNDKTLEVLGYLFANWRWTADEQEDLRHRIILMAIALRVVSLKVVNEEHKRRVGVVINEINSFLDNVLQVGRIAPDLFDYFDPRRLWPLLNHYLSGNMTDAAFKGVFYSELRASASRRPSSADVTDWLPGFLDIGEPPDTAIILPAHTPPQTIRHPRSSIFTAA